MKTDPRRFAPLGLVLSLLAFLSFLVILIIKGLNGAGFITLGDTKTLDQAVWVSLAIIVLGLAATAFLDPEGTRKFFTGRQVQYGSNSFIMLAAFLGHPVLHQSDRLPEPGDEGYDGGSKQQPGARNH
jgi:F0F1-type ATP synthase membrane subunit a